MKTNSIQDLYREYQRRLDVRQLLEHYGAQNCSENTDNEGRTWITHSCLLDSVESHHTNGDARPSASVCVETGHYHCFSYWSGSVFALVQKLEGVEDTDRVLEVVAPYLSGSTRETTGIRKQLSETFTAPIGVLDLPLYPKAILDSWGGCHPYMYEVRGIDEYTHGLLRLGYAEKENRIVFPHFWHGNLVGWQMRAIPNRGYVNGKPWDASDLWPATEPEYPKYKNSPHFPKKETLYCYDPARKYDQVLVVESPMSVAKAEALSLPEHGGIPVVATFGASVSEPQIVHLMNFSRVYIWFDDDPAGHAGERKLVEGLYRSTSVLVVPPEPGKDLADYTNGPEAHEKIMTAIPAARWLRR